MSARCEQFVNLWLRYCLPSQQKARAGTVELGGASGGSATGGIYWLDDAKEVPDRQIVTDHYPDLLLSFELGSFGNDQMMHAGQKITGNGPTDFGIAYYGTEALETV
jgi:hypothetical protein